MIRWEGVSGSSMSSVETYDRGLEFRSFLLRLQLLIAYHKLVLLYRLFSVNTSLLILLFVQITLPMRGPSQD